LHPGSSPYPGGHFPATLGQENERLFRDRLEHESSAPVRALCRSLQNEDVFDEIKTSGGFADCRQRSFKSLKRHASLSLLAYSLLRLLSITMPKAHTIEAEPWWQPEGAPSVTRLRRAVLKALRVSWGLPDEAKVDENTSLKMAA
jgi:hypothetical protein